MSEYTTQVGMDVHARSVTCKALRADTGEYWSKRFSGEGMEADLAAWVKTLPGPVRCVYESGCTGFELCRFLREAGVACDIIAVTTLPRSSRDRRHKNDKADAGVILSEIWNPASKVSYVWVPDRDVEGARDLVRAADAASRAVRAKKQKIQALLLKHGFVWNEKTPSGRPKGVWTVAYRKWVRSADLGDPLSQRTLGMMLEDLDALESRDREFRKAVAEETEKPRWKPYVDALCMLKGVAIPTAFLAVFEFGDFSRFRSGRKVSQWIGCTPAENTTGDSRRQGAITKEGSSHLRRSLVEGNASISRRTSPPKKQRAGHEVSAEVTRLAREADVRLRARYRHLVENGKHPNTARVAIVGEQIRWIWRIGLQVRKELAAA